MESWNPAYAYAAIFTVSLLASTLLPLGSEWLLVALLLNGFSPLATVIVATAGNTLGACTTYAVGRYGGHALAARWLSIKQADLERSQKLYARYGCWTLLFSWLPVIGDPLCAFSGFFKMRLPLFAGLVLTGKLARYSAVAWLTLSMT